MRMSSPTAPAAASMMRPAPSRSWVVTVSEFDDV
jgi:hypothetical protein